MAKRNKPRAVKESVAERDLVLQSRIEGLMEAFGGELPVGYTDADFALRAEDIGWLRSTNLNTADLNQLSRRNLVQKSRVYWRTDPVAKQSVRLWTDYALGNGITFNSDDPAVMKRLQAFCNNHRNRDIFSRSQAQRSNSNRLLIDGDLFFAIFGAEGQDKVVRMIDALQITDMILDPEDSRHVLAYRRQLPNSTKALFYADRSANSTEDRALAEAQKVAGSQEPVSLEENVAVYHLAFDPLELWGNGLLFSILDWSREHRRFMEARVGIVQALSKFAWKMTAKGGQAALNKLAQRMKSTYADGPAVGLERNPQTAPAANWLQNAGLDIAPMPRTTGAGDAMDDGRMLKLMMCAGAGIMEHYYGDGANANLATAVAMELPMLKQFESYQQLWLDADRDIFAIVLDEKPDQEPAEIDIDLPPILSTDLKVMSESLLQFSTVFPELKVDEVLQSVLVAMNINNVDQVMKTIKTKRKELDAQQTANDANLAKLAAQATQIPANGAGGVTKESIGELVTAFNRLSESMEV